MMQRQIVGNDIKNMRLNARYSQQRIADVIDVTRGTYRNYESDRYGISLSDFIKLAHECDLDLEPVFQQIDTINENVKKLCIQRIKK
ncbi:helix-turn-helix transcriptional regulator [Pseudoalteromonas luteoviolacea]|uniref:helix-turn-helix transcriptional regulator n=1 Tax=Pseudoalteromonas luteoviolacea TaxID=43657 RepID=UPI0011505F50|nr:helix-turn-helix transcriptional regulator [Pseudoalteromonas luteoviolacea]TQF66178.1 helix-turn-helix transcriptional regulator [Pseudoalteromonas luteoviolacea]